MTPEAADDDVRKGCTLGLLKVGRHLVGIDARHLSEVTPILDLKPMLGGGGSGLGLVTIRGSLIPVCDPIALCTGRPSEADATIAAVLTDREHVFALGVDGIAGLHRFKGDDIQIVDGSATLRIEEQIVHIIDAAALLKRSDVPRAEFRMRRVQQVTSDLAPPHLTFSAGGASFAIRATGIFGSVPRREIEDRSLASGHFLGLIESFGRRIPILDTCRLLGVGSAASGGAHEIVVLRVGEDRLIGLAVDKIRKIEHFSATNLDRLEARFRKRMPLIEATARTDEGQTFIIDFEEICADGRMCEIAEMSERTDDKQPIAERPSDTTPLDVIEERVRYLVFTAGVLMAAPMTQIVRISPVPQSVTPLDTASSAVRGFFYVDGALTPLISLAETLGFKASQSLDSARVLLVGDQESRVAFLVDRVDSIAVSNWRSGEECRLPGHMDMVELRDSNSSARVISRADLEGMSLKIFAMT